MVVIKKPQSNKLRICMDPRDLNQALLRRRYQQPTIEDILPQLSKTKVLSVLDAKNRFWKIEVVKNAIWNQHRTRGVSKKTN